MSAREVIEQIKRLSREEQLTVARFIHAAEDAATLAGPHPGVSENFKRAADELLTANAELFRKLAQ